MEQLSRYNDKISKRKNCSKLLITLINPLNRCEIEALGWNIITYSELINRINESIHLVADGYLKSLIDDYTTFSAALINIVEYSMENEKLHISIELEKQLKELRIFDVVSKYKFEFLKFLILNRLKENDSFNCEITHDKNWHELRKNEALVKMDFTRGTPLVEIKIKVSNARIQEAVLGIQLQYRNFKLLYQKVGNYEINNEIEEISSNNTWFNFKHLTTPIKVRDRQRIPYCKYKHREGTLYYKYKEIDDCKDDDVVDLFEKYTLEILKL